MVKEIPFSVEYGGFASDFEAVAMGTYNDFAGISKPDRIPAIKVTTLVAAVRSRVPGQLRQKKMPGAWMLRELGGRAGAARPGWDGLSEKLGLDPKAARCDFIFFSNNLIAALELKRGRMRASRGRPAAAGGSGILPIS